MKIPAIPEDENDRIAALDSLGIVYSPAEERFDRITRLAKKIFDVPIVLISLVTSKTQWFKSCQGLTESETSREVSFCAHAILMEDPLVIFDTFENPDFADNPLVTKPPFIRFYAGQAIIHKGKKIGTLCVIDSKPHVFFPSDIDTLRSLANWVENELKISALGEDQKNLIAKYNELERKTLIDSLTGAWNLKGFNEILKLALSRAERTKTTVGIMKVHLDKVRYVADDTLTEAPSIVLQEITQRIRTSLRPHDVIGRHRENEFVIFLADGNKESTEFIAQRIMRNVSIEPVWSSDGKVMATLSIGIASNEGNDNWNLDNLIKIADSALYDAIIEGGNKSIYRSFE